MIARRFALLSVSTSSCALAAIFVALLSAGGCPGRAVSPIEDAGNGGDGVDGGSVDAGVVDGGTGSDAGAEGEGEVAEGEGEVAEGEGEGAEGEGEGELVDAGNGFDLGSLLDAGIPGLECLPSEIPELSISGAFDALGLGLYTGQREDGVRCGDVTCIENAAGVVPCCGLCGLAGCGVDISDAGEPAVCPFFTASYLCDDEDDCSGSDICCFTLGGTECRAEEDCDFDVGAAIGSFLGDGGLVFPDAGLTDHDAGFLDGGFALVDDGDGGVDEVPVQGPAAPFPDAGSLLDGLQTTLDQGVPVCTSTFFDCELLQGEACCTSDRLVAVDLGFCLPALLCLGDLLP